MKLSNIGARLATLAFAALLSSVLVYGQQSNSAPRTTAPTSDPGDAKNVALGKRLLFAPGRSDDGWLPIAGCHVPAHGFSDSRRLSVGMLGQRSKRNAPTLLGRGLGQSQFWDGRAASLEEQVLQPILNPEEMGMTMETLLPRLHQDPTYRGLTRESLADALSGYVRTIRSEDSNFHFFLSGWPILMRDLDLEGLRLFQNKARCYLCHSGRQFTAEPFHNTGVAWSQGAGVLQDEGRAAITGKRYHRGAFKTPTLRDVALRGPYMHDGSLLTLEDVIDFYDRGGNQNPYLDENIIPLHLSQPQTRALSAFLRTGLSGSVLAAKKEKYTNSSAVRQI